VSDATAVGGRRRGAGVRLAGRDRAASGAGGEAGSEAGVANGELPTAKRLRRGGGAAGWPGGSAIGMFQS
jgi:hypothetical protein